MLQLYRFNKKNPFVLWLLCLMLITSFFEGQVKKSEVGTAEAASGDVILLWENSTSSIPAGWTCVSCKTTDGAGAATTFFNLFPRASSSFAAASSGVDSVTHTLAFSASTTGAAAGQNGNTAGSVFDTDTHSHSWGNPTLTAESILPPYKNLLLIKASNPTKIPANAIGMFSVSSGSLPPGWTYYSAIENLYLRTSNSSSTGGSSGWAATTTALLTSGNAAAVYADPGNGMQAAAATHNHTIAAASALNAETSVPSYIGVVFAQANADTAIPNGLMAFFDAAPPSGWVSSSTAGSAWDNRLIVGSTTFGNTGGSSTHNHGGSVTWTSSGPSATAASRSGSVANTASQTHTHDITYTVSTATSIPTNRGVIVGKKLDTYLTQANYRWYSNVNSDTPTTALATLNSSSSVSDGDILRLRMNVAVATSSLSQLNGFKLQFATSLGGPWENVGLQASSSAWIGYDNNNATTTDGITLASNLLTSSTVSESYEEENPSVGTPNSVGIGGYAEWDWAIKANGVSGGQNYYFRMVKDDLSETALDNYLNYPAVTTQTTMTCSTNISSADFGNILSTAISTATPNASTTMTCSSGTGCSLYIQDQGDGANPGLASSTPAILIPSNTVTLSAGTEGYGVQATTTTVGSGGTLRLNSIYDNWLNNNVGGLSRSTVLLASSTVAVTNREVVVAHKAAVSGTTPPAYYGDTITYSCTGN